MNIVVRSILTIIFILVSAQAPYAQAATPSFDTLLIAADTKSGEKLSRRCEACHTFKKGEPDKMGPNLWDVVGHDRAHAGHFNYSDEMKSMHSEKWTYDALNLFLTTPQKYMPGNKMAFAGIPDPKQRADLIMWMRSQSDNPIPLPTVQ